MAQQRSAALVVACLLASQPLLAELAYVSVSVAGQALDAADSSGEPHCKKLFKDWQLKGGIPQSEGQTLSNHGVKCLSPCKHRCNAMLGGHQDFAAFCGMAASFDISSLGLLEGASRSEKCSLGFRIREKCLVKVPVAKLDAVNAKLAVLQATGSRQNEIKGELVAEKNTIVQWGSRVRGLSEDHRGRFACKCSSCAASLASFYMRKSGFETGVHFKSLECQKAGKESAVDCDRFLLNSKCQCYQCFGGTDQQDLNSAGEGSFLLGGAGKRYLPETADAMRGVIQQYVGDHVCPGSCDYDRRMFTGMQ